MPVARLKLEAFPVAIPPGIFNPPRRMRRPRKPTLPSPGPCPGCSSPFTPALGGGFNAKRGKGLHRAVDIMAGEGALIVAPIPAIVPHWVWITTDGGKRKVRGLGHTPKGGHTAWLFEPRAPLEGHLPIAGFAHYFAHALEPFRLELGQHVSARQILGLVGRSGNATASDGYGCPHLHYAARRCRIVQSASGTWTVQFGTAVDPGPELKRLRPR
jgi:murein DD-endopeptidase MepM/ murein hydrolase activator NlpD